MARRKGKRRVCRVRVRSFTRKTKKGRVRVKSHLRKCPRNSRRK